MKYRISLTFLMLFVVLLSSSCAFNQPRERGQSGNVTVKQIERNQILSDHTQDLIDFEIATHKDSQDTVCTMRDGDPKSIEHMYILVWEKEHRYQIDATIKEGEFIINGTTKEDEVDPDRPYALYELTNEDHIFTDYLNVYKDGEYWINFSIRA